MYKREGRLCKMCNLFFNKFCYILPANVFKLVCYTATKLTTKPLGKRVDSDPHLAHLL